MNVREGERNTSCYNVLWGGECENTHTHTQAYDNIKILFRPAGLVRIFLQP